MLIKRLRLLLKCIIAITIQFIPPRDKLFIYLRRDRVGSIAELSDWYFQQSCDALTLHENDSSVPSIDLVEVYLVQMMYLGISKNHAEEMWRMRGSITSCVRQSFVP